MKLPLAYYGNPILRKKVQLIAEITPEIKELVKDMEETMMAYDGIGIAAPQVNISLSIFIINIPKQESEDKWEPTETRVFINPKILEISDEEWDRSEGCLSIPKIYGTVTRPTHIKVEATNLEGITFVEEFSGLTARAILHENDHLNGVLFIDRIRGKERLELEKELKELKKKLKAK